MSFQSIFNARRLAEANMQGLTIPNKNKNITEVFVSSVGTFGEFRMFDNYKNIHSKNDGLSGFRIVDNYNGNDSFPIPFLTKDVLASDGTAPDELGWSVGISKNFAIAGAPFKTVGANTNQGVAYLYNLDTLSLKTEITAVDGTINDHFGYSVAVNDSYIIIGANNKTISSHANQGSCYVYDTNGLFITELTALLDGQAGTRFGFSVAINKNNRFIVGATGLNDNGYNGSAYVYDIVAGVVSDVTELFASNGASGDDFGHGVAISDSFAIVGAPYRDNGGSNRGSVYIYNISATPSLVTELTAFDASDGNSFGYSVAISENFAIIGTPFKDASKGAVYIYNTVGVFLSELTAFDGTNGDDFGNSVSISGNRLLVGSPQTSNSLIGAVYIYNMDTNPPTFLKKILQTTVTNDPEFGYSVAINGSTGIAGFPQEDLGGAGGFTFIKNIM